MISKVEDMTRDWMSPNKQHMNNQIIFGLGPLRTKANRTGKEVLQCV